MDCIISAGGTPKEEDLLYEYTRGRPKALLDMAGKPMVQWVVDALTGAKSVERIILVGLRPEDGITSPKLTDVLPDQGSLVGNMVAGVERALQYNPDAQQVVMATADIPTITPEMVDGLIAQCADPTVDAYYTAVERSLMEARFPNSRRSYVHFTDGDLAGGDIHIGNPRLIYTQRELAEELLKNRKSALKQIRKIGFGLFVKLLLRRLSLQEAEERISKSLNLKGKAALAQYAELGMDVDKPFQLEICRQALLQRDK